MIHDLDIVAELAGAEVERVEAVGVAVLSQTQDIANARLRLAGGCIVDFTASRVSLQRPRQGRLFPSHPLLSPRPGGEHINPVRRPGNPPGRAPPPILSRQL